MLFGVIVVTCFLLSRSANPVKFFNPTFRQPSEGEGKVKLERILERAATADKTVIVTTLNEAWAAPNSIFDLFLESFHIGNGTTTLLKHLVVVALDCKAYDRCLAVHTHCYLLNTPGTNFSGEAFFMSPIYLRMMWRRIDFLKSLLEMGYNFIFTDTDIMWLRDPFPRFYPDGDFQIACDFFWGKPADLFNQPNGGFNFVKSNNRTVQFYKFWYESRIKYPKLHDQDVFNKIKFDPFLREIGIKVRFLSTAQFSGFCQPSKNLNRVCTMHANCCTGLHKKIHDLKVVLEAWRKFSSTPPKLRASRPISWKIPQKCRL
ncbi:hypothetical protein NMG60_11025875 [Bertholletia excelsa]